MIGLLNGVFSNVVRGSCHNFFIQGKYRKSLILGYSFNGLINRNTPVVNSRYFSLDSLVYIQKTIFRTVIESEISAAMRDFLILFHDSTGLPWWCTITASAAFLKLYSMPFKIYQLKLLEKQSKAKEELDEMAKFVRLKTQIQQRENQWTPQKANIAFRLEMRRQKLLLISKYNCHPLKSILSTYLELPVWIFLSITWRTMSYGFSDDIKSSDILMSQMLVEGPFWCPNLTLAEPKLFILVGLSQLAVVELFAIQAKLAKKDNVISKIFLYISRSFVVFMCIISAYVPSAVVFFWISSSCFNFIRDLILMLPRVRQIFGLSKSKITIKDISEAFQNKFSRLAIFKGSD